VGTSAAARLDAAQLHCGREVRTKRMLQVEQMYVLVWKLYPNTKHTCLAAD
jgi:hypothetical protein